MSRTSRPWNELTPQQQLNRQRNEAAKAKKMNVYAINGEEMAKVKKEVVEVTPKVLSPSNPWISIASNLLSPDVVFPLSCLCILSSYLVWQYSTTPTGDISTGIVIEGLGIIYATIATISKSKWIKFISLGSIIATIVYTSIILHGGLETSVSKNDNHVQSLISQRQSLQSIINSKSKMAEELPMGYVSKKQQIMSDVNKDLESINKLNVEINTIKTSSEGDVLAGLIIRILSMVANAYMAHLVVRGIRKN